MFHYYCYQGKTLFSKKSYDAFTEITESDAQNTTGRLHYINEFDPLKSRKHFSVSTPSLLFIDEEGLDLLSIQKNVPEIPAWIQSKIDNREVIAVNKSYPDWESSLDFDLPKKWRVNILALGDVGGTLLTGLRLLGKNHIREIGIYDSSKEKLQRWEYELNQVTFPFDYDSNPEIKIIEYEQLFDCDMFVFCASKSVPAVGAEVSDVRMVQFQENSKIISTYAKLARESAFKGIFAVVSDPVDLLSKVAFLESNKDASGNYDFKGLSSDQVIGYGLGVMNARAVYYAKQSPRTLNYLEEGRAFGPHGSGLIIANSISNFDECLSKHLTDLAVNANLKVRETGFKPYIAPALSSGTMSILSTIRGDWHYSTTYMGGVFMGANNRLTQTGIELEQYEFPEILAEKLKNTYDYLADII